MKGKAKSFFFEESAVDITEGCPDCKLEFDLSIEGIKEYPLLPNCGTSYRILSRESKEPISLVIRGVKVIEILSEKPWGTVENLLFDLPEGASGVLESLENKVGEDFVRMFNERYNTDEDGEMEMSHEVPVMVSVLRNGNLELKKPVSSWDYSIYTDGGVDVGSPPTNQRNANVHLCVEKVNLSNRNFLRLEIKVMKVDCLLEGGPGM